MKQRITGIVETKTVKYNTNNNRAYSVPNYEDYDVTVVNGYSRWKRIPRKYVISDTYKQVRNEYCKDLLEHYKKYRDSNVMNRIKTRIEMVKKYAFVGEIVSFIANITESNRIVGRLSK